MKKDKNRYLLCLQVSPKAVGLCSHSPSDVSKLLGVTPTEVDMTGSWSEEAGDTWFWSYSIDWVDTGGHLDDITSELVAFLRTLPNAELIWEQLSEQCEYHLYLPLQRDYFLIEFQIGHEAMHELALRKMNVEFSAKSG